MYTLGDGDSIYPDVVDAPVFMVSDALKKLLAAYDPNVVYRRVMLNQKGDGIQKFYVPEPEPVVNPSILFHLKIHKVPPPSESAAAGWHQIPRMIGFLLKMPHHPSGNR